MDSIRVTSFSNGASVATIAMPQMRSVCMGVWAMAGSRHESRRLSGIAHFTEHLVFKGTRRRRAAQIQREIEGVGGTLNAFTEIDHTCYYAKAASGRLDRLADVLGDIYRDATIPADEVAREREVIEEEIVMYHENPGQHVEDVLAEAAWPGSPLGRPITGTEQSLSRIGRTEIRRFIRSCYTGRNTLVTAAGALAHEDVLAGVQPWLESLPAGSRPRWRRFPAPLAATGPRLLHEERDIEQSHLNLAFHAPGARDDDRFALKLLSVILGENMSSRLFQQLREERGLCYSVQSDLTLVRETGLFSIYAGIDPEKLAETLDVTIRALRRIARTAPSRRELSEAREYAEGMLEMSRDSVTQQMLWLGESFVAHGRAVDPESVRARLAAVTPDDVRRLAAAIFRSERAALAIVGPPADPVRIYRALRRLGRT